MSLTRTPILIAAILAPFAVAGALIALAVPGSWPWVLGGFGAAGAMAGLLLWRHVAVPPAGAASGRLRTNAARGAPIAAILDALPMPLLIVDRDQTVVETNAAARALLPRAQDNELVASLRAPALLQAVEDAARAGTAGAEFTLPEPPRHFAAQIARLPDDRLLLVLIDVTATRRAHQMRADFVANVSHEMRTPLATLVGFIETLRGPARDDPEARERFLAIMNEQAARMSRLVADLLSLSRIEEGEHAPPTDPVNPARIIGAVVDALAPQARARGLAVAVQMPAALPPVTGDADQLSQVFQNLIDNAIKYSRQGGAVTIAGSFDAKTVTIAVTDQGEGIAAEHLPRLTERFYRVDTGRSRAMGGTGLGLAIVKHVVARHRARLEIESRLGKGSTFRVIFPRANV